MALKLTIFQAQKGDAIDISFIDPNGITRHLMVDSGTMGSYKLIQQPYFKEYPENEAIDRWILTHLDADHIAGALSCFRQGAKGLRKKFIKSVWFNFFGEFEMPDTSESDISMHQAIKLRDAIHKLECDEIDNEIHNARKPFDFFGATITILSPDKATYGQLKQLWEEFEANYKKPKEPTDIAQEEFPDDKLTIPELSLRADRQEHTNDIVNKSSIAFLLEYAGESVLMLGDAHPSVLINSIERLLDDRKISKLPVTYLKLAHHGSINNHSQELMAILDCHNFIISTNGNNEDQNPNKETLSKILNRKDRTQPYNLFFNYHPERYDNLFSVDENAETEYNYIPYYPTSGQRFLKIPKNNGPKNSIKIPSLDSDQ